MGQPQAPYPLNTYPEHPAPCSPAWHGLLLPSLLLITPNSWEPRVPHTSTAVTVSQTPAAAAAEALWITQHPLHCPSNPFSCATVDEDGAVIFNLSPFPGLPSHSTAWGCREHALCLLHLSPSRHPLPFLPCRPQSCYLSSIISRRKKKSSPKGARLCPSPDHSAQGEGSPVHSGSQLISGV